MKKHRVFEIDTRVQAQIRHLPMLLRFDINTLFESKDNIEFKAKTGTRFTNLIGTLDTKLCRYYGIKIVKVPRYCFDIDLMQQSISEILLACYNLTHGKVTSSQTVKVIDIQALTYVQEHQEYTIKNTIKVVRPYMNRRPRNHLHYKPVQKYSDNVLFKYS
jgi:hypothetical protein